MPRELPLRRNSSWSSEQIVDYLGRARIPIRVACNGDNGFPLVCSLWFVWRDDALWCVTHEDAHLLQLLQHDNKCAFEIADNTSPYKGVRGQALAEFDRQAAKFLLPQLIERYLNDTQSKLAKWLLGRIDEEVAIRLPPEWIVAWDYSDRMQD